MDLYPFEIHITTQPLAPERLTAFSRECLALKAKPLLIELARGAQTTQPMLGKVVHQPTLAEALLVAAADSQQLQACSLPVSRVKIETAASLSHLATPAAGPAFQPYFEWHGKVAYQQAEELLAVCLQHQAHLSANALRHVAGTRFVTLREYGTAEVFGARISRLTQALQERWPLLKQESECCVYDSNASLDAGWLPQ